VVCVAFNRDGDLLFTAGKDGLMNVWHSDTGERLGTYPPEKGVIYECDVSHDTSKFIAAFADQKVMIYATEVGRELESINIEASVKSVEWNRRWDKQDRFVQANDSFNNNKIPKAICIWAVNGGSKGSTKITTINDYDAKCNIVRWGPFDETIISGHDNGYFYVWNASNGKLMHSIAAHTGNLSSMSFNEDRTLMLTCSLDGVAKLWETRTFKELKVYNTDRPLNACGISPLVDSQTNRRWHILLGGGQAAEHVTTTASSEGKFQTLLWNMVYASEIGSIRGGFGPINTLKWFPDGSGFVTGGEDGFARIHKFDDSYWSDKYF